MPATSERRMRAIKHEHKAHRICAGPFPVRRRTAPPTSPSCGRHKSGRLGGGRIGCTRKPTDMLPDHAERVENMTVSERAALQGELGGRGGSDDKPSDGRDHAAKSPAALSPRPACANLLPAVVGRKSLRERQNGVPSERCFRRSGTQCGLPPLELFSPVPLVLAGCGQGGVP